MGMLNVLVVVISTILLIYWYIKRSFSYWKSKGVPYNEPVIPHGNIKGVGTTMRFVHFIQNYYTQYKGTSKLCGIYFFNQPIALLLNLDLIKRVLVKDFASFDRSFYYNEKDDPLSGHLVALDGVKWKNIRVKLTPTFTAQKMKFMYPTITKVGERLTTYLLDAIKDSDELGMKNILERFTIDVIGTCAFGIECNTLKDTYSDFYRMSRMAVDKPRHNQRIAFFLNKFKYLARLFGCKAIRDDVSTFFMNVVHSTIEYRETNNVQRNDFMDLLINLKNEDDVTKSLTVDQIAAQSFLFFIAGYGSSSTTMLFTIYELALNPLIQTTLRQEIQQALKRHREFSYDMMMDIPYLDQVINETLRKYPPFITLTRIAQNDYKVPDTSIVIEKGISVIVPVFAIHRDPEYYTDPEKFNPNRFSAEETKKRDVMAWLAFGEGQRNCIARRFGMMQIRIGLITLFNNFEFLSCTKTPVPMVFGASPLVLSPKDDIVVRVKRINMIRN